MTTASKTKQALIDNLPVFDPAWPDNLREMWLAWFAVLWASASIRLGDDWSI